MDTNALAYYPASTAQGQRPCSRCRPCPLAECILRYAGAALFVSRLCAVWSILSEVNHQLESRMRENRQSGSEGGGTKPIASPYPYEKRVFSTLLGCNCS